MSEYSSKTSSNGEWERMSHCLSDISLTADNGDGLRAAVKADESTMRELPTNKISDYSSSNGEWDRMSQCLSDISTDRGEDLSDIDSDETTMGEFSTKKYRSKLAEERAISKGLREEVALLTTRLDESQKRQDMEMEKLSLNLTKMFEEKMKGFEDLSKKVDSMEKEAIAKEQSEKQKEAEKVEEKDDWFVGSYSITNFTSNYRAPMEMSIIKADRDGFYVEEVKYGGQYTRNEFRPDFRKRDTMVARLDSRGLYIEETKEMIPKEYNYTVTRDYGKPFKRDGCQFVVITVNDVPTEYWFRPY